MRTYFLALLSALTTLVGAWGTLTIAHAADPSTPVADSTSTPSIEPKLGESSLGSSRQAQDLLAPAPKKDAGTPATAQADAPAADPAPAAESSAIQILSPKPSAKLG